MSRLENEICVMCKEQLGKSFSTHRGYLNILLQMVAQLKKLGFDVQHMSVKDLKGRHVNALLKAWRAQGLSIGSIKNRMSVLRWWARTIGNPGAVKTNKELGIGERVYVTNVSKATPVEVVRELIAKQPEGMSYWVWTSVRLQALLGFRRETAMKFQPRYALDGQNPETATYVRLMDSWTKGGKVGEVIIRNDQQRALLKEALALAKGGSMIPDEKEYVQHMKVFERETHRAGVGRSHGLRHYFAQMLYRDLTGWDCRAVAGHDRKFTPEELEKDEWARKIISNELNHSRKGITSTYLGSMGK